MTDGDHVVAPGHPLRKFRTEDGKLETVGVHAGFHV
jgi:hypothetical protein